ncbi:TetR/AcrR family transcriptional regulator [Actinoplanes sp. CA-142083]|uniref:TetR/AcrR family transcriptional regulator n=1 Tax=Actinoplanes sp. CA-142083 TaxID=3239903 RepID=UPI003D949E4E
MANTAGRAREAARNDETILAAAREVFLADPRAPISAVAERAGVGIGALYRRYAGKEDLLRTLCHDGLRRFIAEAERASREDDDWTAFETFLRAVVDADVHSLTVHLAGTFVPTAQMNADAVRAKELATTLFSRARRYFRPGAVPDDITMLLEMCAAGRAREFRRRYVVVLLDGMRAGGEMPGPPPAGAALGRRWGKP